MGTGIRLGPFYTAQTAFEALEVGIGEKTATGNSKPTLNSSLNFLGTSFMTGNCFRINK